MPKKVFRLWFIGLIFFLVSIYLINTPVNALYIPRIAEDAKKQAYQQKVKTYSSQNQQKLDSLSKKIIELNKKETDHLSQIMERQAQVLDEFDRRNLQAEKQTDGKTRNLSNPDENAHYWLTYAHEAVAYQAAKNYIFTLTTETNIKSDAQSVVTEFESDITTLQTKVAKSQKVISDLVSQ